MSRVYCPQAYRPLFMVVSILVAHSLGGSLLAQSSSRVYPNVLPTVVPTQTPLNSGSSTRGQIIPSQPTQGIPVQGSSSRQPVVEGVPYSQYNSGQYGVPVQGQVIQGQVIQGQPIQGQPIQGQVIQGQPIQGQPIQGQIQGQAVQSPMTGQQTGRALSPAEKFDNKLWNYLVRSKYKNWAPVPGKSDAAYPGDSPHGAFLKMYLNRKAAGNPQSLPDGSMVIKENYSPARELAAITVMYKTAGYNPKAGNWYWVKYNPDGTVANKSTEKGMMRLSGRVGGCIDCHSAAEGDDFAYFND